MTSPVCLLEQHRGQKLQRDFPLLCLSSSYQLIVAIARCSQQTNLPFTTLTVGQLGLFHPAFSAALMAALKLTRFGFTLHTGMVFLESQLPGQIGSDWLKIHHWTIPGICYGRASATASPAATARSFRRH